MKVQLTVIFLESDLERPVPLMPFLHVNEDRSFSAGFKGVCLSVNLNIPLGRILIKKPASQYLLTPYE
jgi:hypothetical protein